MNRVDTGFTAMNRKNALAQLALQQDIPANAHVILRLLGCFDNGVPDNGKLAGVIIRDPVLSWKILRLASLCNPAPDDTRGCVHQAAALIGSEMVYQLAARESLNAMLPRRTVVGDDQADDFWRHSLRCAFISELIASEVGFHEPADAYLAGLLHEIGKWILLFHFPGHYQAAFKAGRSIRSALSCEEEMQRFGIDHAALGARLLEHVPLLLPIADAVRFHHFPTHRIMSAFPLVKITHIAGRLGTSENAPSAETLAAVQTVFAFDEALVDEIVTAATVRLEDLMQSFGVPQTRGEAPRPVSGPADDIRWRLNTKTQHLFLGSGLGRSLLQTFDQREILRLTRQHVQMLCGIDAIRFFLYDQSKDVLTGYDLGDGRADGGWRHLEIPVDLADCLPVAALRTGKPLDSFSDPPSSQPAVIDEQLIRRIGAEGMACIPMRAVCEKKIGCILMGIDRQQAAMLKKRLPLVQSLAGLTADALVHAGSEPSSSTGRLEPVADIQLHIRKAVHEINTPLSIVKNYLRALENKAAEHDGFQRDIRAIDAEINRIGRLLQALAGGNDPPRGPEDRIDPNALLSHLAELVRKNLPPDKDIQFHLALDSTLTAMKTRGDPLKQVILNLINNAVEALPTGGNVYLKSRLIPRNAHETEKMQIIVQDDGPGLPATMKDRLFKPSVTTKKGHQGLGLSIASELMKQLNGTISCESRKDAGTWFFIELPAGRASWP